MWKHLVGYYKSDDKQGRKPLIAYLTDVEYAEFKKSDAIIFECQSFFFCDGGLKYI